MNNTRFSFSSSSVVSFNTSLTAGFFLDVENAGTLRRFWDIGTSSWCSASPRFLLLSPSPFSPFSTSRGVAYGDQGVEGTTAGVDGAGVGRKLLRDGTPSGVGGITFSVGMGEDEMCGGGVCS